MVPGVHSVSAVVGALVPGVHTRCLLSAGLVFACFLCLVAVVALSQLVLARCSPFLLEYRDACLRLECVALHLLVRAYVLTYYCCVWEFRIQFKQICV